MTDVDGSWFRIDLPSVLYAYGNHLRVDACRNVSLSDQHPGWQYLRWYVKRRGLVLASDVDYEAEGADTFPGGCIRSIFVSPSVRNNLENIPDEQWLPPKGRS